MEIDITGRHFHISEPLKEYIDEKVLKLDKYSLKLESVHIVLEVQKFHHVAEITALSKHFRVTAKEESIDMYAAFDKAFGNIQLQFRKHHEKLKDHKARRYEGKDARP